MVSPSDLPAARLASCRDRAAAAGVPVEPVGESVVARPRNADEVAASVRLASECALGVAADSRGELPADAVRLDLSGLSRIVDFRPADMLAVVEAGVTSGDLAARAAEAGLVFPPARLQPAGRSIGDLLARGGARGLDFGPPRDYLLGLRFVSASGKVVSVGSRAIKNATGYSLTQLLLGGRHQLGIIVEATLRLAPCLPASRAIVAEYPSFAAANEAALAATPAGGPAAVLEAFDPEAASVLPALGIAPGRAALLGLVEATDDDLADARLADLRARLAPGSVRLLDCEAAARAMEERRSLGERLGPADALRASISAPRERMDSLAAELAAIGRSGGRVASVFGEVGSGALTLVARPGGSTDSAALRGQAVEIARAVHANGGAILDLRGFGLDAWDVVDIALSAGGASALRAAKDALDPKGTLRSARD